MIKIFGLLLSFQFLFLDNLLAHTSADYLEPILIDPVPMHRGVKRGKCPVSTSIFLVDSSSDGFVHVPFLSKSDRAGFHICLASEEKRDSRSWLLGRNSKMGSINEGFFLDFGWEKVNRFFEREDVVESMTYADGAMFTFTLTKEKNGKVGFDSTIMTFDAAGEFLITAIDLDGNFISPTYILPQNMHIGGGAYMGRYIISLEKFFEGESL